MGAYLFLMFYCIIMSRFIKQNPQIIQGKFFNYNSNTLIYFLIILVYAFVVGLRYHVGADWITYYEIYSRLNLFGVYYVEDYDIGYYLLNVLTSKLNLGFYFITIFVSILTILLLFKSICFAKFLLPIYFFFFFCIAFTESLNTMRQIVANLGCFYAIQLLLEKKWRMSLAVFILAWSFHKSSIFALSYCIFLYVNPFNNRNINILLLVLSFVLGEFLYENFKEFIISLGDIIPNSRFALGTTEYGFSVFENQAVDWNAQIAKYFYLLVNILIVWIAPQLKKIYKGYYFTYYFSLFMTGQLLQPILIYHSMFQRLNYFYYLYCILMLSFTCYALWHYKMDRLKLVHQRMIVIAIYLVYFVLYVKHIMSSVTYGNYHNYVLDVVL